MTKTPYELRFELLSMAQSILSEKTMNERIKVENDWNMLCEHARSVGEINHTAPYFPTFPDISVVTETDIIEMAKKLNEFVSNTGE